MPKAPLLFRHAIAISTKESGRKITEVGVGVQERLHVANFSGIIALQK
jgi:hypothetical protein